MNILLQIWGSSFYLGNKVFLALSEGRQANPKFKTWGWVCYLIGLPAWVIILALERNWILSAIELGSVFSMLYGLLSAVRGTEKVQNSIFAKLAVWSTYVLIPVGVSYSLYDYGGLVSVTQLFEIGAVVGFLVGTYLLAKNIRNGWLFFMLMNGSVALLMYVQFNYIMAVQQVVSLGFVVIGYVRSGNRAHVDAAKSGDV